MRYLITISTCHDFEKNGNNQTVRDTWLKDLPSGVDYKFVVGHGQGGESANLADYLLVDTTDGIDHLTYKTKLSKIWALEHDYDFVFQCPPDCYVVPSRLLSCGFEKYDYVGDFGGHTEDGDHLPGGRRWAYGGSGYWLSRAACEAIASHPVTGAAIYRDELVESFEDMWVGHVLGRSGSFKYLDSRRFVNRGKWPTTWPVRDNEVATVHLSMGGVDERTWFNPDDMRAAHKKYKDSL